MYKEIIGSLKVQMQEHEGFEHPGIMVPTRLMKMLDGNTIHHFWLAKQFRDLNGKVYYVPKNFAAALAEIDRPLPVEYFPYLFCGWIQFGEGGLSDEEGNIEGGFVYIGPAKHVALAKEGIPYDPELRVLQISYTTTPEKADVVLGSIQKFSTDLRKETLDELCADLPNVDYFIKGKPPTSEAPEEVQKKRNRVIRALINAALYISSSEPELMKLRPLEEMSHRQRSEYKKTHPVDNLCTLPITLVNWQYEGLRQSHVDSSLVQTHMRWQPCGPQNSQVKLIWVKEHERHYKKEESHE
jgi:hypothetical protein